MADYSTHSTTAPDGSQILGLPMMGAGSVSTDSDMKRAIQNVMGEVADPHFRATVEQTLREMAAGSGASTAGGAAAADPVADGHLAASVFSTLASQSGAAGADAIANTLGMLGRLSEDGGGGDAAAATEGLSDTLIAKMMSEFETMGGKDDFAQVTDGMSAYIRTAVVPIRVQAWNLTSPRTTPHATSETTLVEGHYVRAYAVDCGALSRLARNTHEHYYRGRVQQLRSHVPNISKIGADVRNRTRQFPAHPRALSGLARVG